MHHPDGNLASYRRASTQALHRAASASTDPRWARQLLADAEASGFGDGPPPWTLPPLTRWELTVAYGLVTGSVLTMGWALYWFVRTWG